MIGEGRRKEAASCELREVAVAEWSTDSALWATGAVQMERSCTVARGIKYKCCAVQHHTPTPFIIIIAHVLV